MPIPKQVVICKYFRGSTSAQWGACQSGYVPTVEEVYVLNDAEAQALQNNMQPFSAELAGQYFGFAFVSTISIWALAYGAGQLVSFVRKN